MMSQLLMLVAVLLSSAAIAADDRTPKRSTEYKCYFIMADGTELVNYMMSKDNYAKKLQQQMNGATIYAKDGITRRSIKEAIECVKADKAFYSFDARQLDKQTLK